MNFDFWTAALIVAAAAAAAGFVQRVSGFGFGIFAMMFLPYVLGVYGEANMLCSLLSIGSNLTVLSSAFRPAYVKKTLWPLLGFAVLTVPAVLFMKRAPAGILFLLLGAAMIVLSVWFVFFSSKVKIKPGPGTGIFCGGLSGIMAGLFAMGGPPVVVYFLETSEGRKEEYVGTIQLYFLITNLYAGTVKACAGFLTRDVLTLVLPGIAGMAVGTLIGAALFKKLDAKKLRYVVYGVMAASGVFNAVKAIVSLAG